jgi:hypothetical protein
MVETKGGAAPALNDSRGRGCKEGQEVGAIHRAAKVEAKEAAANPFRLVGIQEPESLLPQDGVQPFQGVPFPEAVGEGGDKDDRWGELRGGAAAGLIPQHDSKLLELLDAGLEFRWDEIQDLLVGVGGEGTAGPRSAGLAASDGAERGRLRVPVVPHAVG